MKVNGLVWTAVLLLSAISCGHTASLMTSVTCQCSGIEYFIAFEAYLHVWNNYGQNYTVSTKLCQDDGGTLADGRGDLPCLQAYIRHLFNYYHVTSSARIWLYSLYDPGTTLEYAKPFYKYYALHKSVNVRFLCQRRVSGFIPTLPVIPNATPSTPSLYPNTAVTYTCDQGYWQPTYSEPLVSDCSGDGYWSIPTQNCSAINCSDLSAPANGKVTFSNGNTYNSKASFTCSAGYLLSGQSTLTCSANETWTTASPTCTPVDCGHPTAIENANVTSFTQTTFRSNATYSCRSGYEGRAPLMSVECLATGSWDTTNISCQAINCSALPAPSNGQVTFSQGIVYQSTATFACNTGYNISGQATLTCLANEVWNGSSPVCKPVDCGRPPTLALATPSFTGASLTVYPSSIAYVCQAGYESNAAPAQASCLATGKWDISSVKCEAIKCGSLNAPANGQVSFSRNGATFQSTATFACQSGYVLVGASTATCQATKAWSGNSPVCNVVDCGTPPTVPNASPSAPATTYQSTATYTCVAGYKSSGTSQKASCLATGKWDTSGILCQAITCSKLSDPANGRVAFSDGTRFKSTATFFCLPGYGPVGSLTRSCLASTAWSGSAPVCILVDCGTPPTVPNASPSAPATTYQSTATYTCVAGYKSSGTSQKASCLATGKWDTSGILCQATTCSTLSYPANGHVAFSDGTRFRSIATFSCLPGYVPVGSLTRSCLASTAWSGNAPVCRPVSCGIPLTLTLASPTYTSLTYKSLATYTCQPGYKGVSSLLQAACLATGRWDTSNVKCEGVDCGSPPSFLNSVALSSGTGYNSQTSYSCVIGYQMTLGTPTVVRSTCQATGRWQPVNVSCQVITCKALAVPHNGYQAFSNGTVYGAVAIFACFAGFVPFGSTTLHCQLDTTWSSRIPVCASSTNCPAVNAPANGAITHLIGSGFGVNTVLGFTCKAGFKLVGASTTLCPTSRTWTSQPPVCQAINCPSLANPANGQVSLSDGVRYQSTAKFICLPGFMPRGGSEIISCQEDKSWSGSSPTCTPVDCGQPPTVPSATPSFKTTTYLSPIVYYCRTGFVSTSAPSGGRCESTGTWNTGNVVCTAITCPKLEAPTNGYIASTTGTVYNAVTRFACFPGFAVRGSTVVRCQLDKFWNDSVPQCSASANCPSVRGSLVNDATKYKYLGTGASVSTVLNLTCHSGSDTATSTGASLTLCLGSDKWTADPSFCKVVEVPPTTPAPQTDKPALEPGSTAALVLSGLLLVSLLFCLLLIVRLRQGKVDLPRDCDRGASLRMKPRTKYQHSNEQHDRDNQRQAINKGFAPAPTTIPFSRNQQN